MRMQISLQCVIGDTKTRKRKSDRHHIFPRVLKSGNSTLNGLFVKMLLLNLRVFNGQARLRPPMFSAPFLKKGEFWHRFLTETMVGPGFPLCERTRMAPLHNSLLAPPPSTNYNLKVLAPTGQNKRYPARPWRSLLEMPILEMVSALLCLCLLYHSHPIVFGREMGIFCSFCGTIFTIMVPVLGQPNLADNPTQGTTQLNGQPNPGQPNQPPKVKDFLCNFTSQCNEKHPLSVVFFLFPTEGSM